MHSLKCIYRFFSLFLFFVLFYVLVFGFYLINCQIALVRQMLSEPDNKNVCDVNEVKAGGDNSSPTARNLHCML